jgi:hypothetical protein
MYRMYHEGKAKRCQQNLVWLKGKLQRLEGVRVKKIEDTKAEIKAIEESLVTLRCDKCNCQFTIPFSKYVKGDYVKLCVGCKKAENADYIKYIKGILDNTGVKYEHRYCSDSITMELPHKHVGV